MVTETVYPKDCCGGKCQFRCYPVARVMFCPTPPTKEEIDAAKLAFDNYTEGKHEPRP